MTVKISAPFKLDANQRKVFVDSTFVNVAAPVGRQDGDYLYSASVTILRENNAVYTTAPMWASVEVEGRVRPGRAAGMRDHALSVEAFNPSQGGTIMRTLAALLILVAIAASPAGTSVFPGWRSPGCHRPPAGHLTVSPL